MAKKPTSRERSLDPKILEDKWDTFGDVAAYGTLADLKIVHAIATNPRSEFSRHTVPLAPHVWIRFERGSGGLVKMLLELPPKLTIDGDLKPVWAKIRKWQALIEGWAGPQAGGAEGYLWVLHKMSVRGRSTRQIVEWMAEQSIDWIRWYQRFHVPFKDACLRLKAWDREETDRWMRDCDAALQGFRLAGGKDVSLFQSWFECSIKYALSDVDSPIDAVVPIDEYQLREKLRYFRKQHGLRARDV